MTEVFPIRDIIIMSLIARPMTIYARFWWAQRKKTSEGGALKQARSTWDGH